MLQKEIMVRIIYDAMQRDVMSVEPATVSIIKIKNSVKNEKRFFLSEKRIFGRSISMKR